MLNPLTSKNTTMKFIILLISLSHVLGSCNNNDNQAGQNASLYKFDQQKWNIQQGDDHPYRDEMLDDLVAYVRLKGLKKDELINLLGKPSRIDSSYFFYRIVQERIGLLPLHTKTLVIKLNKDGIVEWRKIHE